MSTRTLWVVGFSVALLAGCGEGNEGESSRDPSTTATGGTGGQPSTGGSESPSSPGVGGTSGGIGGTGGVSGVGGAGTGGMAAGAGGTTGGVGGTGGTGNAAGAGGTAGSAAGGTGGSTSPAGPEDGDPSKPIVEVPNVACGPNSSLAGLTSTNVTIGGRDVHVAYPCNKHEDAPMVFILNLHGTMPAEELKLYQVAYFAVNELVGSHNFITAAPKAVGSQWGNGDSGQDLPHLMEVIDWVYETFSGFDIRAMWVAGHSWGAMYSSNFACNPDVADKIQGAVLQSGSGAPPPCADQIALISSAAENDIGPVIDQGSIASAHGCGAAQENMLGNNVETYWPDCDPGFVHANYFMLGKQHADYMDPEVVERIGDLIKQARP